LGLDGTAQFDDQNLALELRQPPAPQIPAGHYRLISAARSEADYAATEAHLLRLSSPLGQWLLEKAKTQQLTVETVRFDISHHPRKISMLQPLIGQAGWVRLDKLTLDSDSREEFLLLTGHHTRGRTSTRSRSSDCWMCPSGVSVLATCPTTSLNAWRGIASACSRRR
jgi:hypothetical protein